MDIRPPFNAIQSGLADQPDDLKGIQLSEGDRHQSGFHVRPHPFISYPLFAEQIEVFPGASREASSVCTATPPSTGWRSLSGAKLELSA
jgi:hypothetical protein